VQAGETLWRITQAYGADLEEVIVVNNLDAAARIQAGEELLIPNPHRIPPPGPLAGPGVPQGAEPERLPDPAGAETLASLRWPAGGAVLSRFGRRGRTHHDGIDIDGMRGDPIRAAADGRVMFSGLRGSYGRTVVLDHGGGISTLYAHAEDLSVRRGEQVSAGQKIGRVGRTGNASGSHLHFEIRLDGRPLDPLEHLPLRTARAGSAR
jgi:murein DD-endopeptidase MepM/ murein hydrolase activator NlpD